MYNAMSEHSHHTKQRQFPMTMTEQRQLTCQTQSDWHIKSETPLHLVLNAKETNSFALSVNQKAARLCQSHLGHPVAVHYSVHCYTPV